MLFKRFKILHIFNCQIIIYFLRDHSFPDTVYFSQFCYTSLIYPASIFRTRMLNREHHTRVRARYDTLITNHYIQIKFYSEFVIFGLGFLLGSLYSD